MNDRRPEIARKARIWGTTVAEAVSRIHRRNNPAKHQKACEEFLRRRDRRQDRE